LTLLDASRNREIVLQCVTTHRKEAPMVSEIGDKVRDSIHNAKEQFGELQEKAKSSFTDVRQQVNEVPEQLRGAWERVVGRIWGALEVPSRQEFEALDHRLAAIERRLDRLARAKPAAAKRAARK
jgi:hypothetical protein